MTSCNETVSDHDDQNRFHTLAKKRVLVTGASGFIGRRLVTTLGSCNRGVDVTAVTRKKGFFSSPVTEITTGGLNGETDWRVPLKGVDDVIHLAARVHATREHSVDPASEFRKTNVKATVALAEQAARAGVKRFVFLSSIKVNGQYTQPGRPFTSTDTPAPQDAYAQSKAEAEELLHSIATETGMEVVIIRPPLVYGPGVRANFAAMIQWLRRGIPLPLGRTQNRRSLLALDNLIDLIMTCLKDPNAANQTFLASDGQDISTTELLHKIAATMNRKAWLVPLPPPIMHMGAKLAGREDIYHRLFGSLQVDISPTQQVLDWRPPLTLEEGLCRTLNAPEST